MIQAILCKHAATVTLLLLGMTASVPGQSSTQDYNQPVTMYGALPAGEEVMAEVRARLPQQVLIVDAVLKTRVKGKENSTLRSFSRLDFGNRIPNVSYDLFDMFGARQESLQLQWQGPGQAVYLHSSGEDMDQTENFSPDHALIGLDVTWSDLSLAFLWWDGAKSIERGQKKRRRCIIVDVPAPKNGSSSYSRVRLWVDEKEKLVMQANAFNQDDELVRKIEVDSIKKINDIWMVKDLEIKSYPQNSKTNIIVEDIRVE